MVYRLVSKITVIIVITTGCFTMAFAQKGKPLSPVQNEKLSEASIVFEEPERKDPFIAGVLSWSWSGLGQFYTQNYRKGSAFLLADIAGKGLLVYMLFDLSEQYSRNDEDVSWSDINRGDQLIVIGLICSIFINRVLSVVDAVNSAHEFNREIYYPYWKSRQVYKSSSDNEKVIHFSVSYSVNFK